MLHHEKLTEAGSRDPYTTPPLSRLMLLQAVVARKYHKYTPTLVHSEMANPENPSQSAEKFAPANPKWANFEGCWAAETTHKGTYSGVREDQSTFTVKVPLCSTTGQNNLQSKMK